MRSGTLMLMDDQATKALRESIATNGKDPGSLSHRWRKATHGLEASN